MPDIETFTDRLSYIINQKKISIREFERITGVGNAVISSAIRNNGYIGADKLIKISATFPDINMDWLLNGKGDAYNIVSAIMPKNTFLMPTIVLDMDAMAGLPVINHLENITTEVALMPGLSFRMQLMIRVKGDSMAPELVEGDVLIISPVLPNEVEQGKMYVITTIDGETLVKIVNKDPKKRLYMLMSLNPYIMPMAFEEGEINGFYRVLAKVAKVYE